MTDVTELKSVIDRVSNWGRWGPEDQLGTVNHITPAKRLEAAANVHTGEVFSLALPITSRFPQASGSPRRNARHEMTVIEDDGSDDVITMFTHGATHWDALSHIFDDGQMYNGFPMTDVTVEDGARQNDIVPIAGCLVSRGVLVDVARAQGEEALAPGYEITPDDVEQALADERSEVRSGDILLLRTGHLGRIRRESGWEDYTDSAAGLPLEPGIGLAVLEWLHDHEIAAIACDNWALEVTRSRELAKARECLPVHVAGIVYMGLTLGESFDLDGLAAACASDQRFDFLLSAASLPIVGSVGGVTHPIAVR